MMTVTGKQCKKKLVHFFNLLTIVWSKLETSDFLWGTLTNVCQNAEIENEIMSGLWVLNLYLWGKCIFTETDCKLITTVRKRGTCPSNIKSSLQGLFFQLQVYDLHIELKSGRGLAFTGTLVLEYFI